MTSATAGARRRIGARTASLAVAGALLFSFVDLGCDDGGRACYPGDWRGCECAADAPGYAQCDPEGTAYGACDCSGVVPAVAASSASGAGGGGGGELLPFMATCALDEECETGVCFDFNAKGPRCSQSCAGPADCPPPSPGCNMMGICKAP